MNKGKKWLIGALCMLGLGFIMNLLTIMLMSNWPRSSAHSGGWILHPLIIGFLCSSICTAVGIILGAVGMRTFVGREEGAIIRMNKGKKWLISALCISGLGVIGEQYLAALVWAPLDVGLEILLYMGCSPFCKLAGIVLGVVGFGMFVKK